MMVHCHLKAVIYLMHSDVFINVKKIQTKEINCVMMKQEML